MIAIAGLGIASGSITALATPLHSGGTLAGTQNPAEIAQSRPLRPAPTWYNCRTRERWSPDKQTWCRQMNELRNARYSLPDVGEFQLQNGAYVNVPQQQRVTLVDRPGYVQFGDLDNDQKTEGLVVLAANTGSSGTFYYLVAVTEQQGQLRPVAATLLGDRIQVQEISVVNGQVKVELITQGPNDPMCCPTLTVTANYTLQANQFQPLAGTIVDTAAPADRRAYSPIDLARLPPDVPRRGDDPQAIAVAAFGVPTQGEGLRQEVSADTRNPTRAVVIVTQMNLPDDSLLGRRYRVEFVPEPGVQPLQWRMVWAGQQQVCRPGRGVQAWTVGRCF